MNIKTCIASFLPCLKEKEIRVRPLQLRILYENLKHDPASRATLLDYMRNFHAFLMRNTMLPAAKIQAYLCFLKYFKMLVHLHSSHPPDAAALAFFLEQLRQENTIIIKKLADRKRGGITKIQPRHQSLTSIGNGVLHAGLTAAT